MWHNILQKNYVLSRKLLNRIWHELHIIYKDCAKKNIKYNHYIRKYDSVFLLQPNMIVF
jgi:hypothetical protein